jgi:hypothetical protein
MTAENVRDRSGRERYEAVAPLPKSVREAIAAKAVAKTGKRK